MTNLTKSDIPASIRGLNWLEATEVRTEEYHGKWIQIITPRMSVVGAPPFHIELVVIKKYGNGKHYFRSDWTGHSYEIYEVDYFVPII